MILSNYFKPFFVSCIAILAITFQGVQAQLELPEDKVDWSFSIDQNGESATVIASISTEEHWHINAIKLPDGSFGFPSEFKLEPNANYKKIGSVIEPKPIEEYDEIAKEQLAYHKGTFQFKQKIKILSEKDFTIKGSFGFQTCNEEKCLPPHFVEFTVNATGFQPETSSETDIETSNSELDNELDSSNTKQEVDTIATTENGSDTTSASENIEEQPTNEDSSKGRTLWGIFIISLISGFVALVTPCVFPMIPMTVSFFTKQSKNKAQGIRNAIIFGLSIIVIYIVLGTAVVAIFGEQALNDMSTNPWFNLAFFLLLVIFAVSFLGAFEIRLPNSWINKADQKADKGGLIGIFFMALALALVSFSCTGPIVGSLIVESARQGGLSPIIGMFGFSLALALPFALFAAFPGWMNSLPKSGGWLNAVKVVLGFLELAFAFKFLSNADMTWDLHFLEREVFIAIWIAIFLILALYLFGKIRMPHDSPIEKLSVSRTILGIITLTFVIYLIPGMWGAPLKKISAFPPPLQYSEAPLGFGGGGGNTTAKKSHPDGTHLGPQNIFVFHDYDKALAHAKKVNKPLFVDFTGINCVNCRRMEQNVWGEPGIVEKLRNDVVIVSLHTDERDVLPKEEQGEFEIYEGKTMHVKTTGDKWKVLQIKRYNILAQPYYVMLDTNENDLPNGSADYEHHSSPTDFKNWLEEGLKEFERLK